MKRVEFIQRTVAEAFGVSVKDLLSAARFTEMVTARHVSTILCHKYSGLSMTGAYVIHHSGSRKGATNGFRNSAKVVEALRFSHVGFAEAYDKCIEAINQHDAAIVADLPERLKSLAALLPPAHPVAAGLREIIEKL